MPPRYNAFPEQSPTALLDGDASFDPMAAVPRNAGADDASPMHLIGNPGSGPGMPAPTGTRPNVPTGQPSTQSAPAPGRQAAPQQGGFQNIDDNYVQAYRQMMRQEFPDMDEKRFNAYVDYGIAKQRGKLAAQNKKLLAKPLGQYFGALQQESTARNNVEALRESMKAKQAEFMRPDGSMEPEWMPYQDKIDSAIMRAQQAGTRRKQMQEHLGKYGVKPEYLENQITLMEFMRQLAGGDPSTAAEIGDDDPLEVFGDGQTDAYDPSAGVLR